MKVMIYGSGHSGCAHAAYLGKAGHEVHMFDIPEFGKNLTYISERGGLNMVGYLSGYGPIAMATTDLEKAIDGVKAIIVIVPAFAHETAAKVLAPYLRPEHIVLLSPGGPFGSIAFKKNVAEHGGCTDFKLAEAVSSVFACRRSSESDIWYKGIKEKLPVACLPARDIDEVIPVLKELLPYFVAVPNIVYTSMANNNAVVHPFAALLNTGRIENQPGKFDLYWEGITPSVGRCQEALDRERLAVAKAMGFELMSMLEEMHMFYDHHGGYEGRNTLYEFFDHGYVNGGPGSTGPTNMQHRYITEDIPYGIVPMAQTAKLFGVPCPHMDALITIASTINSTDYMNEGRTLKSLGLDGLTREEFMDRVING